MKVIRSAHQMVAASHRLRQQGKSVGVVPTMGALHAGHLSLIRAAAAQNDVVIVTIFVNPLQFGPHEDFARYPRPFVADRRLCRAAGVDIIFAPQASELYPLGFQTMVDVTALSQRWEGQIRPGHFRGVVTVVAILFTLTHPTRAYFGQKDYQQAYVIRQMVRDLRVPVTVQLLPTVREPDGLAMSSRNRYLTPAQRRDATVLHHALRQAQAQIRAGERRAAIIQAMMRRVIHRVRKVQVDYAVAVDAATLEPLKQLHGRVALLVAVRLGPTRLIDNLLVDVS